MTELIRGRKKGRYAAAPLKGTDPEGWLIGEWLKAVPRASCPPVLMQVLADPASARGRPGDNSPGVEEGRSIAWHSIFVRAHANGIAPLFYASLKRWGLNQDLFSDLAPFRSAYRATLRQNLLHLDELGRITRTFRKEGIDTILLKGAALLLTTYPDPGLRPMGDIDLLVHEKDVSCSLRLARAMGYTLLRPDVTEDRLRTKHEIALARRLADGTRIYLEIHWRFLPRESLVAGPVSEPQEHWAEAIPTEDQEIPAKILSREDFLLFAALHLQRHAYSRAVWIVDIALLLQTGAIDWQGVLIKAESWQAKGALYAALRGAEELCGARVPAHVMRSLRPGAIRARLLEKILKWHDAFGADLLHGEHALSPIRRYLLKLIMARDTLAALQRAVRMLFPSDAWLRARYGLREDAFPVRTRIRHIGRATMEVCGRPWYGRRGRDARMLSEFRSELTSR